MPIYGILEGVIAILEVKVPFTYWVVEQGDDTVKLSIFLEGKALQTSEYGTVIGVVKAGFTQKLTGDGWVSSDVIYYVEATTVKV